MKALYDLKINIDRTNPEVWRIIAIPASFSLYQLHHAIQIAFGWGNYHLYSFEVGRELFSNPQLYEDYDVINDRDVVIADVLSVVGDTIRYEYDFGDSWVHFIKLVDIRANNAYTKTPICIDGKMACPPEDCSGIHNYKDLLQAINNPTDDNQRELLELHKDFDPSAFNITEVNRVFKAFNEYIVNYEMENDL